MSAASAVAMACSAPWRFAIVQYHGYGPLFAFLRRTKNHSGKGGFHNPRSTSFQVQLQISLISICKSISQYSISVYCSSIQPYLDGYSPSQRFCSQEDASRINCISAYKWTFERLVSLSGILQETTYSLLNNEAVLYESPRVLYNSEGEARVSYGSPRAKCKP